jgi:hypothetical protein
MCIFTYFTRQQNLMDLTQGSETSAKLNLTPWRHPIEHIHDSEHGENLKSRTKFNFSLAHGGNYLFLIELLTLNSNM